MIEKTEVIQRVIKSIAIVLVTAGSLFATSAFALEVNVATMLKNFGQTVPNLMRLVTAVGYVLGIYFLIKGLMGLKHYGETRTQMSSQQELMGPVLQMIVGTALLYLPASVQTGVSTFWLNASPLAYEPSTQDNWSEFIQNVFMIIQLIGTFAFIRGLIMLTRSVGHSAQQGTASRAFTHIIGGIFCINMYQFIQTINNTLSLGQI